MSGLSEQGTGVPASPSGHSRAEPEEVSALRASVPNAVEPGNEWWWHVVQRIHHRNAQHERGLKTDAELIAAVKEIAEFIREGFETCPGCDGNAVFADGHWLMFHDHYCATYASAIEARRAETQGGSVADESATREGDAHD